MASLESRIAELEKKTPQDGVSGPIFIMFWGTETAKDTARKLTHTTTGQTWEIKPGETEDAFLSRVKDGFIASGIKDFVTLLRE